MKRVLAVMILALAMPTVTAIDFVIESPTLRFTTGQDSVTYTQDTITFRENPRTAHQNARDFDHNLRVDFWRDSDFHPLIFQQRKHFRDCGRYPVRNCIDMNKMGGFVRAPDNANQEFMGYGAYERLDIEDGKLYPRGPLRDKILQQNLNKLRNGPTRYDRTRRMPQQR